MLPSLFFRLLSGKLCSSVHAIVPSLIARFSFSKVDERRLFLHALYRNLPFDVYDMWTTVNDFSFTVFLLTTLPWGISKGDSRQKRQWRERVRSNDCKTENEDREKGCKNEGINKMVISEKRNWTRKNIDSNEMHLKNGTNLVRHRASYSIVTCPVWVLPYIFPNFHAWRLFIKKIRRVLEIRRKQETGFLLKGLERFTIGKREWQECTKCENVRNCGKKEVKLGDRER